MSLSQMATFSCAALRGRQCSSVQSLSRVQLFATPWTAPHKASLSITNSRSLLKLMSIKSVMTSNHLILCHPLLLQPSIFPSIRVFSNHVGSQGKSRGTPGAITWAPRGNHVGPQGKSRGPPGARSLELDLLHFHHFYSHIISVLLSVLLLPPLLLIPI